MSPAIDMKNGDDLYGTTYTGMTENYFQKSALQIQSPASAQETCVKCRNYSTSSQEGQQLASSSELAANLVPYAVMIITCLIAEQLINDRHRECYKAGVIYK